MNEIKALLTAILGELATANRLKTRELIENSRTESERAFYLKCAEGENKICETISELIKGVLKEDG